MVAITTRGNAASGLARTDRRFFSGMSILITVVAFVGFGPTYFLKTFYGTPALPSQLVHVHGILLTSWIALFLIQTALVASNRTDLHRRLGGAGAVLALTIFPVSLAVAITAARNGSASAPPNIPPLTFMAVPVMDLLLFTSFVAVGFYNRRRPEAHKRLMLLGTFALLSPAVGRFFLPPHGILVWVPPFIGFIIDQGFGHVLVVACMCYDFATRRRVHPAFLWGGLILMVLQQGRLTIGGTGVWLAIAGWLVNW